MKRAEEAPLLVDGAPSEEAAEDREGYGGEDQNWLQRAGRWLLGRWMILAIVLLIIGGVIAVVIYFAGKSRWCIRYRKVH